LPYKENTYFLVESGFTVSVALAGESGTTTVGESVFTAEESGAADSVVPLLLHATKAPIARTNKSFFILNFCLVSE
jgi:hypothetical protein